MRIRRGDVTAGDMLAQQAIDLEYQAMRDARDRALVDLAEQRAREQLPLIEQLATVDVIVDWVGRLLDMPNPDERIYPILLDHLGRPYSPWLLEWIGRAFGRRSARPIAWDTLISLIRNHTLKGEAVEGLMAAISVMAHPDDVGTLIDLLSDPSLGSSRVFLIGNLMRSKRQEARIALLRHQLDPDLTEEITRRLSRSRA